MATTDVTVSNLIINTLTAAQYATITPSDTELYMITDEVISASDISNALGYTPYNGSANPSGFKTTVTSTDVTSALGYTPYNGSTNPNGYITSSALTGYQTTANLTTVITSASTDSTYPSAKAVYATVHANETAIAANTSAIADINTLIPAAATSSNQLADKNFVNSSIATNTANFIGTFSSVSDLEDYSGTVTNNDYAFVVNRVVTDSGNDWATFNALNAYDKTLLTNFDYAWVINGSNFDLYRFDIVEQTWDLRASDISKDSQILNTAYNRYKATVSGSTVTWDFEYTLNNSSFTAAQWAAINSGITAGTAVTHTDGTAVGSTVQPVYITTSGAAATIAYTIAKSVPSDAVFTDTTYSVMTGATSVAAGATGLVPQPASGDNAKFLRGDGTWAEAGGSQYAMVVVDYTA